jgi:pimeloyl-ACP methyl ester carboxylesterase
MMKRTSATPTAAMSPATTTRREFVKRVGALAGATLLLGQTTLSAHAESSREVEPSYPSGAEINVVLVQGAYLDASSWSKVIPLLQANGYNALAGQLPLASFKEDVTTTEQALASLSGPTILVGHSNSGSVISNVGSTVSNLVGLVYVAAFAPEERESIPSINAHFPAPPLSKYVVPSYRSGFLWIDPAAFPQNFIQDVEVAEARALAVTQKPIAPACFSVPSGFPLWKRVPSWYLVSQYDRAINPDAERFMARRMGATTREIASSHASPVSHPQEVFDFIVAGSQGARH